MRRINNLRELPEQDFVKVLSELINEGKLCEECKHQRDCLNSAGIREMCDNRLKLWLDEEV